MLGAAHAPQDSHLPHMLQAFRDKLVHAHTKSEPPCRSRATWPTRISGLPLALLAPSILCVQTLKVRAEAACPLQHGLGAAPQRSHWPHIAAGISRGQILQVSGEGGAPRQQGGSPGDLVVEVDVQPDPTFERVGDDLHVKLALDFTDLALGTTAK